MCRAGAGATTVLARWATIMVLVALATVSSDALASLTFYTNKATFQAAAPGLVTEDFEAAHLGPDGYTVCTDPFAYVTSDDCWSAGGVLAGITIGSSSGTGALVWGPGLAPPYDVPSIAAGAADPADAVEVGFPAGSLAVGMDLFDGLDASFSISVYGSNNALLGSTSVPIAAIGGFFGVKSTQAIKRIELTSPDGPLVDNVLFAAPAAHPRADMTVSLSDNQGTVGTLIYTLTATNLGPDAASGVVVSLDLPNGVSYVSDDCGGSNASPPWSRTVTTLALSTSFVCHVTTSVTNLGPVQARVASNGSIDLNPANDTATDAGPAADLAMALTGVQAPPGTMTYTMTVTNMGPHTAWGVVASVDIPVGVSYVSDDCGGSNASPPWSRTIPTLALNASVVCHITTTVTQLGVAEATVVSNGTADLNPANDTATFSGPVADLGISLDGVEAPLGTMTYTLTVANQGPDTASGIVASVDIPPSLAYVSNDCGGSNASPPWQKTVATLASGASVVCHIVATILNPHVIVNATVLSSGSTDLDPENDFATAYGPVTDLGIELTGVENPPGSMMLTVTVTNLGTRDASSIVATLLERPSALTYVSDDCGGSNSLSPWTWNISSLANGNNVVCHIQTTVATPQGIVIQASVASNGPVDPNDANDHSPIYTSLTGPGPGTPVSGTALFRSFYDLPLKDETGAAFSLRSHADKVMLLQICAVWCGPCNNWTSLSAALAQAVDQKIGAGHFLDVDLLAQGPSPSVPSTQSNAQAWKSKYSFPGPVVHAEGSATSPLSEFVDDTFGQYAAIQSQSFFPEFFILAPDCNNQIAVRVAPGAAVLGEQRGVDTSTVDEMANLIADVWNDRPCVKPVLHRLDRCNVGSAQIYSNPQTGDFAEAAEPFDVPGGQKYVVSSVTAVTDASILDFTVYADAAGHPGAAVCTSAGRSASEVYAPSVKRIDLDKACKLTSGNYWMSLKGHSDVVADFVPTWHGGFLAPAGAYFYRDNAGCTAWNAAGECLAGQQNAQLCYVLETDVVFSSGFEPSAP